MYSSKVSAVLHGISRCSALPRRGFFMFPSLKRTKFFTERMDIESAALVEENLGVLYNLTMDGMITMAILAAARRACKDYNRATMP